MTTEITEANFINLANNMAGTGLITTGEANYELAKDYAKQESIAFAKFAMDKTLQDCNTDDKWTLDDFSEVTDEQLYSLFKQQQSKNKQL